MAAFALLKFWKSNTKVGSGTTAADADCAETVADSNFSDPLSEESDDDSFFELELTLPNYDPKFPLSSPCPKNSIKNEFNSEVERESEPKLKSKPQSPISILRSGPPKFRVFMFGRSNKKSKREEDFEPQSFASNFSPKRNNSSLFTVKFMIEDGSIVPKFTRSNSSNLSGPKIEKQSSDDFHESSKRFSKDVVQKYLNLIKLKSTRRNSDADKSAVSPTRISTASFPSPRKEKDEKQNSRFKVKCKQLGKSKSASALIGVPSPAHVSLPPRNDHPHDGIEGAILHCKRSLNSFKGHSSLSRCSSDPSHEKSIQVSE